MRFVKRLLISLALIVLALAAFVLFSLRADIPVDRISLQPNFEIASSDTRPVLLFGATRNTGLELAKLLHNRGEPIVAFVRPSSDRGPLEELDAQFLVGDAMDLETVEAAVEARSFRAVVTTVGCFSCDPPVDFVANRNIIDAAKSAGIGRALLVTTIGSGNSVDTIPFLSKLVLGKLLPLKTQAEEHLKASGLNYTIIRPGGLGRDPATGRGILSENPKAFGFINRADLAQLLLGCLDSNACDGKTLAAVDENKSTPW